MLLAASATCGHKGDMFPQPEARVAFVLKIMYLYDMASNRLFIHFVFVTRCRRLAINQLKERELYAYIFGICRAKDVQLIRINGMEDHVHMLVKIRTTTVISDFIRDIKRSSSIWMKSSGYFPDFDGWAREYDCSSVSPDNVERVKGYIINQKKHHSKVSFLEEYRSHIDPESHNRFSETWFDF